jgi:hypothetical protein
MAQLAHNQLWHVSEYLRCYTTASVKRCAKMLGCPIRILLMRSASSRVWSFPWIASLCALFNSDDLR